MWLQSRKEGRFDLRRKIQGDTRNRKWRKTKLTCVGNLFTEILQSKRFVKTEPKLGVRLNVTDRKYSDLESLNEKTSMRGRLSDCSNREVTMYH